MPKGVLRNFTKLTGKHLCQCFFFNKVAGLKPVNFLDFLRTPFLKKRLRTTVPVISNKVMINTFPCKFDKLTSVPTQDGTLNPTCKKCYRAFTLYMALYMA